jgi:hypothetical protein
LQAYLISIEDQIISSHPNRPAHEDNSHHKKLGVNMILEGQYILKDSIIWGGNQIQ